MDGKFLLCFHDFSVWNYRKVMPILAELRDLTGKPFSVLVIPDTEGASEADVEGFREALSQLKLYGYELALHGYKHKAEFSQGRSYAGLVAMNLTHGEAEFAGLSKFESSRLLQLGISSWNSLMMQEAENSKECGKENRKEADKANCEEPGQVKAPVAFVPPTWYSNPHLPLQVNGAGMLYEDRFSLTSADGYRYASPVASFAGIPDFAIAPSFIFGKLILKIPFGVPRIALHPCDFPKLRSPIKKLIKAAMKSGRELARYEDL